MPRARRFAALLALTIGFPTSGPLLGCATAPPYKRESLAEHAFARAAVTRVTLAAMGTAEVPADGRPASIASVRPVTCILLPGGDLLTAAHTLTSDAQGTVALKKDPVTGNYRIDKDEPLSDLKPFVMIVDGFASIARISATDALTYASVGGGASRASVPADWAIITPDQTGPRKGRQVSRIAQPRVGERCIIAGFPVALMDDAIFKKTRGSRSIEEVPWIGTPGVAVEGTIETVGTDRIEIATEGVLGTRGKGLSGGGVFVERNGEPTLVGIAVRSLLEEPRIVACPLPATVRRRF